MTPRGGQGATTLGFAVATTVVNSLPLYLVSALFIQIAAGTGAPIAALGAIVASYWIAASLSSPFAGALAHAIGSDRLIILAVTLALIGFAGTALFSAAWPMLFLWSAIGGAGNGLGHPASNHLMTERVPRRRLAFAFGLKQSSVPIASLLAGVAVPVLALTVGWQWAFGFAAIASAAILVAFRLLSPRSGRPERTDAPVLRARLDPGTRRYLILMACFAALAAGVFTTTVSFSVTSAVHRGIAPGTAGLLLAVASLGGALTRITVGILADRGIGGSLRTIATMQAVGVLGLFVMTWQSEWTFAVGLFITIGFGWGWPGLLHYVIAKTAGPATAEATGIVSVGNYVGNAAMPFLVGLAYSQVNDSPTWIVIGAVLSVAAIGTWLLSRRGAAPDWQKPVVAEN